jgi:hypothetical protein
MLGLSGRMQLPKHGWLPLHSTGQNREMHMTIHDTAAVCKVADSMAPAPSRFSERPLRKSIETYTVLYGAVTLTWSDDERARGTARC